MMKEMDEHGRTNWVTCVKSLLFNHGFGHVWIHGHVGDPNLFLSEFTQRLKDIYYQNWNAILTCEKYVSCINILCITIAY